jgi:hypothetical protein
VNIGVLTATIGLDSSQAAIGMSTFQKQMLVNVTQINRSLATMANSMKGVSSETINLGTLTSKSMNQIVVSSKLASTGVTDFTSKINAANIAANQMKNTFSEVSNTNKGRKAISIAEISNVVAEKMPLNKLLQIIK